MWGALGRRGAAHPAALVQRPRLHHAGHQPPSPHGRSTMLAWSSQSAATISVNRIHGTNFPVSSSRACC